MKKTISQIKQNPDKVGKYILQNLDWSGQYLRNSLSADLLTKILKEISITATGTEVFITTMHICISDSYKTLEETKKQLKSLKLSDFPGKNVVDCCAQILMLAEHLDSAGAFETDLLCAIARIFTLSSEKIFNVWAIETSRKCIKYVKSVQVNNPDTLPEQIFYESINLEAQEEYCSLFYFNQWSPATTVLKADEPTLPAFYQAAIFKAVLSAIKQAGFTHAQGPSSSSGKNNSTPTSSSNIICNYCKAKSYSVDKCTLPQWIFQKPENTTKVFEKNGKSYHWCTKCNCFRIHDTAGHDKWKSSPASQHSG